MNGTVASAISAGPGKRSLSEVAKNHAATGKVSRPETVMSLNATLYGNTRSNSTIMRLGNGK